MPLLALTRRDLNMKRAKIWETCTSRGSIIIKTTKILV